MFENETSEVILNRMLDAMPEDLDKREGSVISDLATPPSNEMAQLYTALDTVLDLCFASTSSGVWLELRCGELGIFRKSGTFGEGIVTFSGDAVLDEGRIIPKGTVVATSGEEPLYFFTDADVTMSNGTASVLAVCELTGAYGNVRIGDIQQVIGDLSSILTVTNEADFTGGSDDESDDSLYERYIEFIQRPVTSGNENHYLVWAKSVAGVGDARVRSNHSDESIPAGVVELILLDAQKLPASQSIIDATKTYIESVRPVGATVNVIPAVSVSVSVSATLILDTGYTIDMVKPEIEEKIAEYITSLAFTDDTVRVSRISNSIMDVVGVKDYDNLTVNGGTANITTSYGEVAVKGTVTLV